MNNNQGLNNTPNFQGNIPVTPPVAPNNVVPNPSSVVTPNPAPAVTPNPMPVTEAPMPNQTYNETSINDLNVDGAYNKMNVAPDYVNDKQIKDNIESHKKNTVPVSKELKTVIIIALILLVFIIIMPMIFDFLNNLRFH